MYQYTFQPIDYYEPTKNGVKKITSQDAKYLHTSYELTKHSLSYLKSLEGVSKVLKKDKYRILIKKGILFDWKDIDNEIHLYFDILNKRLQLSEIFDIETALHSEKVYSCSLILPNLRMIKLETDDKLEHMDNQFELSMINIQANGILFKDKFK